MRRFCETVLKITKAFDSYGASDNGIIFTNKVTSLQKMKAPLIKDNWIKSPFCRFDYKLQQLLSESLVAEGVADVFKVAGLKNPDIRIILDTFLGEVKKGA